MLNKIIEQWIGEEVEYGPQMRDERDAVNDHIRDLKSRIPELEEKILGEIEVWRIKKLSSVSQYGRYL